MARARGVSRSARSQWGRSAASGLGGPAQGAPQQRQHSRRRGGGAPARPPGAASAPATAREALLGPPHQLDHPLVALLGPWRRRRTGRAAAAPSPPVRCPWQRRPRRRRRRPWPGRSRASHRAPGPPDRHRPRGRPRPHRAGPPGPAGRWNGCGRRSCGAGRHAAAPPPRGWGRPDRSGCWRWAATIVLIAEGLAGPAGPAGAPAARPDGPAARSCPDPSPSP